MVICSLSSGIYGNPSQAQYAAGNTYQDTLAQYGRSQGLKAIPVNLGIVRGVDVLAETVISVKTKLWEEVLGIREAAFHTLMKSLSNQQQRGSQADCPVQVCTGLGNADIMASHGLARPEYFNEPCFGPLVVTSIATTTSVEGKGSTVLFPSRLGKANSKEQVTEIVTDAVVHKTAEILQMPASELDPGPPLYHSAWTPSWRCR